MNEKHVTLLMILFVVAVCTMAVYFALFFPPAYDEDQQPEQKNSIKPGKKAPLKKGTIRFPKVLQSYRKEKKIGKLVSAILSPSSLSTSSSPTESARIRAFAMRKLLEVQTPKAIKAYLKYLEPTIDPDLTLVALSALTPKLSNPRIKKAIHFLIFHTPYKPVRAKASVVYKKLK